MAVTLVLTSPVLVGALLLGGDPYADAVTSYDAGVAANPSFADAATALVAPERDTGEGVFPGVVSPFNPPFGVDEIVSIGAGGHLTLEFDEPITDDPANPFGVDLLLFSNTFLIDVAFPSGVATGDSFGGEVAIVEVSADGANWTTIPGGADTSYFPTLGYADAGPYDTSSGTAPTSFTRPVDPAVNASALAGLDTAQIASAYHGSGGGVGVDLADAGVSSARFVRISLPARALSSLEIDAVSDVAPFVPGDANGDGMTGFDDVLVVISSWGVCPDTATCAGDLDGDSIVGFDDLLIVLSGWTL